MTEQNTETGIGIVADDNVTRPESRFNRRRMFGMIAIILVCVIGFYFIGSKALSPNNDVASFLPSPTKQAVGVLGSAVQVLPTVPPAPLVKQAVAQSAVCFAIQDIISPKVRIPALSRVDVTGFTFADGQRVFVGNVGWVSASWVSCPNVDLRDFDRPYIQDITPVPSLAAVVSTPTAVVRYISVPPIHDIVTVTVPVSVTNPNSIYAENGCLVFGLYGVREIWVNGGTPVAGGDRVCDVQSFKVVVK